MQALVQIAKGGGLGLYSDYGRVLEHRGFSPERRFRYAKPR